jgi:hypothetical protein
MKGVGTSMNEHLILCQNCGSEGRIFVGPPNDPHPRDIGECPVCEGTGYEIILAESVDMEDLDL